MTAKSVVFDTNIIIGILNGDIPPESMLPFGSVFISTMTTMEVFALSGMYIDEELRIRRLLRAMQSVPVSESIAERAGFLAKTRKKDRIDVVIAATALELSMPLVTRNTKDFQRIPGLRITNPLA